MMVSMLTTIDNPYDPFTQWDDWFLFDMQAGYNSPGMVARIAKLSNELTPAQENKAIEDAIDEIVKYNVIGVWTKVQKDVKP
jgi:hypothetical protein